MASSNATAIRKPTEHRAQPEPSLQRALGAGDWVRLIAECKALLLKDGAHRWAHLLQGVALYKLGRLADALTAFEQGLRHWPNDVEMQLNQAQVLMDAGDALGAIPILERLATQLPNAFVIWLKLSVAWLKICDYVRGLACAQRCEALARNDIEKSEAFHFKAIHRRELGEIGAAIADCKAAIDLNPLNAVAKSNYLLFLLADPDSADLDIRQAADGIASLLERGQGPANVDFRAQSRGPWDQLRIGFLSPDFRNHSVIYFVEGLIRYLDRRQFVVVGLQLNDASDEVTARVRNQCDEYIELAGRPAPARAELIANAKLDVIVDLAGHTGNSGLPLMASRLAPVQVSWLGFPATTGMASIDYKITDEVTDPEGAESQYAEKLLRLKTLFCCYRPHIRHPLRQYQKDYAVRPAPALTNGYITFGSCNNLGKLTDDVLKLWGQLLHRVPTARLLIEGKNLGDDGFRADYQGRCKKLGIPLERLMLVPLDTRNQYLTYHRIDIALDPFPLTGGTTSFDLLWMGLPLVTLEGARFSSRMSTSILTYLGRTDWVANSQQAYLDIAIELASNVEELNTRRLAQRALVERSPLMNEAAFSRLFGDGIRSMWLAWVASHRYPGDAPAQSEWMTQVREEFPSAWQGPGLETVGVSPGKRQSLLDLRRELELGLKKVQSLSIGSEAKSQRIDAAQACAELTRLVEAMLCARPYDALALSCLAEIERGCHAPAVPDGCEPVARP